jgi:hypothetical protein
MVGHVARVGERTDAFSVLVGISKEGDHLEQLGVDGRKDIEQVGWGGIDWINQAQDRDRWPSLVNAVMNL